MPDRYEMLDINNKLIWNFRDIGHTMRCISEGRGSQKRILIVLSEVGVITQRELTKRLRIKPGSASEVIGKLETAGLIVRMPSEVDRRTADIKLTKEGIIEAEKARSKREKRHNQMFSCLSDEEKDILLSLLEKVNLDWSYQYRENETMSQNKNFRKGREIIFRK